VAEALAGILPFIVGIALSPPPVLAALLIALSPRARVNGLAFLGGWLLGLTAVATLTLVLADAEGVGAGGTPARWATALQALAGVGLLLLAYQSYEKRPRRGMRASMPRWMSALDSYTAAKSFRLAAVLSGVNPKSLLLTIGAMTNVALAGLSSGQSAAVLVVFVCACSVGVAAPVAVALFGGEGAREALAAARTWLVARNAVVLAVLLGVIGAWMLAQSLTTILG
jgi:hypothetical protein